MPTCSAIVEIRRGVFDREVIPLRKVEDG